MELHEFEILEWQSGTYNHSIPVSGACVRARTAEVRASITTGSQDCLVCSEPVQCSVFHVKCDDTYTLSVLHDQIKSEVLNEEIGVMTQRLAVEGVKESVAGTISGSSATVCLASLAVLQRLTTKGALVDLALLRTRKWNTIMFQLE